MVVEPRKFEYIDFADGVEGVIFASGSSKDGTKKKMFIGVERRIIDEMLTLGLLKPEEILDENGNPDPEGNCLWVEIPKHKLMNASDLSTNPRIWAMCDFRGNDMPLFLATGKSQSEYIRALEEENHRLKLHIFSLEKDLQQAESDIARYIREHKERFKPLIEELKELRPTYVVPTTRIRRTKPA